ARTAAAIAPTPQHSSTTTPPGGSASAARRASSSLRRRGTKTPGAIATRSPAKSVQPSSTSRGAPATRRATSASSSAPDAASRSSRASSSAKTQPARRRRATSGRGRSPRHRTLRAGPVGQRCPRTGILTASGAAHRGGEHDVVRFDVKADKGGNYSWWLISSNGQTVAWAGESYASKSNANRAAEAFKAGAAEAKYELHEDKGG